jgi:hypothetical protein
MTVALRGGENFNAHTPPPVWVAAIKLTDIDIERETQEAAARVESDVLFVPAVMLGSRSVEPKVSRRGVGSAPSWPSGRLMR